MKLKYLGGVLKLENLSQEMIDFKKKATSDNTLLVSQNAGERVHLAAALEKPIIYVAKDTYSAVVTHQKLKTYDNSAVLLQPNEDLLFYRKTFQKPYIPLQIRIQIF